MKEISKRYDHNEVEDKIYEFWEKSGFFNPDNLDVEKDAKSYTIILPPPNITDKLHLGHSAMLAIEDLLIRFHRMKGYRALWVPGTDHAAIATQNVVEKNLLIPANTYWTGWTNYNYNDYYSNTAAATSHSNDVTANPSLKWPVLSCTSGLPSGWTGISGSAAMCGVGQSGSNIGANLIYQQGKAGTIWGDTGYNLPQDGTNGQATALMWPFPNEDVIKARMAAYNNSTYSVNGARGFAAPGNDQWGQPLTLTRYIWQYLGNKIPDDIYGGLSDTTPPAAPSGLSVY